MKRITLLGLLILTGCSSVQPINLEQRAINKSAIDSLECDNSGFISYSEHDLYISFKCKNGFGSFVKKD